MNSKNIARRAFASLLFIALISGAGRAGYDEPASTRAPKSAAKAAPQALPKPIQRRAFRFRIHPEKAAGYKAWHRRVAPQLLRDLSAAGVSNYSLFLDKDGTVFGYMESRDWQRVDREMAKSKADAPWQDIMKAYIVQPKKAGESNSSSLEEVFHLK